MLSSPIYMNSLWSFNSIWGSTAPPAAEPDISADSNADKGEEIIEATGQETFSTPSRIMRKIPSTIRRSSPYLQPAAIREKLKLGKRRRTLSAPSSPSHRLAPAEFLTLGAIGGVRCLRMETDGVLKIANTAHGPILHRSSTIIDTTFVSDRAEIAKQLAQDMPSGATGEQCDFTIQTGNSGTAQIYSDLVSTLQQHLKSSLPAAAPRNLSTLNTLKVSYTRDSWIPVMFDGMSRKPLVIVNIGSAQTIHMRSKHNTFMIDVPMPTLSVLCIDPTKEWTNINVVKGELETSPDHHFWVVLTESAQEEDDQELGSPELNATNLKFDPSISDRSPSPIIPVSPATTVDLPQEEDKQELGSPDLNETNLKIDSSTTDRSLSPLPLPPAKTEDPALSVKSPTSVALSNSRDDNSKPAVDVKSPTASSFNSESPEFDSDLFVNWELTLNTVNSARTNILNKLMDAAKLPRTAGMSQY